MVRAIHKQHSKGDEDCLLIDEELRKIQNNLLNIGSYLANSTSKKPNQIANLKDDDITHLENLIDSMTKDLKPLNTFILPGGVVW
jgi:cob(I)alamin adenosyltransferase